MFGSSQWMYSSGGGFYDTEIDGSLRFNDDDSAYLNRTPSSAGNRRTWTFSAWVKLSKINADLHLFAPHNGGNESQMLFRSDGRIQIYNDGGLGMNAVTDAAFRDASAWYHIVVRVDTTNATAADRIRIYVNGQQATVTNNGYGTATPTQNYDTEWNLNAIHTLGKRAYTNSAYFDGYMAEINHVDGQSLAPTSFGETKSSVWIPKAYSGSYGTNGFHLEFAGNANDSSGNGNNWTANNIAASDYLLDSPTLNFCTFNPLTIGSNCTLFEGNLQAQPPFSGNQAIVATFGMTSGKWYWEVLATSTADNAQIIGIANANFRWWDKTVGFDNTDSWGYYATGQKWHNGNQGSYGTSFQTDGDIIGVAFDADAGSLTFYKNGVSQGVAFSSLASDTYLPAVGDLASANAHYSYANFGQDSTFAGNTSAGGNSDANGYGDFKYSVPSGYLALCTANLTVAEAVDPAEDNSPQDYFNTVLYTGTGSTGNQVTSGFATDFIWLKDRGDADVHQLIDIVRGGNKLLQSNQNNAESTVNAASFNSTGVELLTGSGNINGSGDSFVSWNWKANGSGISNTDGSITATVSASADSGFSIATFTDPNNSSKYQVGHGLGKTPAMVIVKDRSNGSSNWLVWHQELSSNQHYVLLNSTDAQASFSEFWGDGFDSDSFGLKSGISLLGGANCLAYCFAEIEGFSKFGSYTGNGSTDGTFAYTGFRPYFVMVKSYTSGEHWNIPVFTSDANGTVNTLSPNLSNAERTMDQNPAIDFVSNGFKIRTSDGNYNSSGNSYIYMAFAENPFKYANAR